jgi:methylenetetrahydrofolate reductase (NADPH)
MHIRDVFLKAATTFSFEFFPPKSDDAWDRLFARIAAFEALTPHFVSVTYGAGGSTRERTHELVERLHRESSLDPIPHLTCVGHSESDIARILERYAEAGVSNILALHGDPPQGAGDDFPTGSFSHAADLVRFIRRFNERGRHASEPRGFGIGVAGFPEGHPATPNRLVELDHLKAKVDEGADYVCTQLFFDNREFFDWRERCRLAGIEVPLVAGIMPITSVAGMKRMAELSGGTKFPAKLLKNLYQRQDDAEAVERIGVHWATEQCRDLLDHGIDGIHFYTLNRSDATQRIFETLGAPGLAVAG